MIAPRYAFFLGGYDLEMVTIAQLLRDVRARGDHRIAAMHDARLAWGARASDYEASIANSAAQGMVPVLVELTADIPLPLGTIEIDHHGTRSSEPAALCQVFSLLDLPQNLWTREFDLVAANDTGHILAMRRLGASAQEITAIRARDRRAQGITQAEEAAGQTALSQAQVLLGGSLMFVHLPHGRTATVADPLALAGDMRDLLVLCPMSVNFFGSGARIARLDAALTGGWRGGELPTRGYWGLPRAVDVQDILDILR